MKAFVKIKRKQLNMSQLDLAAQFENNFQNISWLERSQIAPALYWFFNLSVAFQEDAAVLLAEFEQFLLEQKD